jgi:hypothetical protein
MFSFMSSFLGSGVQGRGDEVGGSRREEEERGGERDRGGERKREERKGGRERRRGGERKREEGRGGGGHEFVISYFLGFIMYDEEKIVISFKGTKNADNWYTNLGKQKISREGFVSPGKYLIFFFFDLTTAISNNLPDFNLDSIFLPTFSFFRRF